METLLSRSVCSRLALRRPSHALIRSAVGSHSQYYLSTRVILTQQQSTTTRSFSTNQPQKVPPNLIIDPRSSFAPVRLEELEGQEDVEEGDESGDEMAAEEQEDDAHDSDVDSDAEEDVDLYIPPPNVTYAVPLPERLHVPVYTLFAPEYDAQVGTVWLDDTVFGREPVRVDLLKRAVNYIRAKKRGKKKGRTKTISEVSGSGRKLRPQKGQGRARVGHSRPPHFRGGAKAHGPKGAVTDYSKTKLNKKVRQLALCHALSQKLLEGNLLILNQVYDTPTAKTNELSKFLQTWDMGGKTARRCLLADTYVDEVTDANGQVIPSKAGLPVPFALASQNIPNLTVKSDRYLNVYRILHTHKLVLTLAAVRTLENRLGGMN